MNDLILNIRYIKWHLQITEGFRVRIFRNDYHCWSVKPIVKVYQFGEYFSG